MSNENWLEVLQAEVNKPEQSQNKVAAELGISTSKLSQTLRGIYPGSTEDIQLKVESLYMSKTVFCPALKRDISLSECDGNQKRPFSSANRERVKLYKACRSGCEHSKLQQTTSSKLIRVAMSDSEIYNIDSQLAYLRREAKGNPMRLNEMFEAELVKLAAKYNQLLWKSKYQK
ncbi:hypothetical protein P3583_09760 [Vibrio parahaemolyticus]|nr:hypothetical protein [Vibrio parahaemolyticus]MDF5385324.1 hypothetical protein [Vibrio parahaemolyticus]